MLRGCMILFVQAISPTSLLVHTTGESCGCGCPPIAPGWSSHHVDMRSQVVCCERETCSGGSLSEWKLTFFDIPFASASPERVVEDTLWRCAVTEYAVGRWCDEMCAQIDALEDEGVDGDTTSDAETAESGPCDDDRVLTLSPRG